MPYETDDSPRRALAFEPLRAPGERPTFRGDIEGLRGVAVLLVVLYHAGVPGFAGGYVGVDVFFALSGYLITGILVAEVEKTGRLDFARFYARRARRLLPAAAVLLLAITAFAYVFYSPLEQQGIAKTALATAAYVSNIYFADGASDYFAAGADTNPLLHTWSLAVEEQFYLGWPLLVVLGLVGIPWLKRGRLALSHRRLAWAMVGLAAVTFAMTVFLMGTLRTHWAFFASPPRAWEFAVGGLGAMLPRVRLSGREGSAVGAHVLGWAGLAAVLAAGALYTGRTPFPGWTALVPVLGTVAALRAGVGSAPTALSRVLDWRPLREAGRLSYSWYLWHWPVLVFAEGLWGTGVGGDLSLPVKLGLLGLSLGLAEGSYRLVEDPVRHQRWLAGRPARGLALLAALTIVGATVSLGWLSMARGAAQSSGQRVLSEAASDRGNDCLNLNIESDAVVECSLGRPEAPTTVAIIGDSHAHHWLPAIESIADSEGWQVRTYLKSACGILDATQWRRVMGRDYVECDRWKASVLDSLRKDRPDITIVSSANSSHNGVSDDDLERGILQMYSTLGTLSGTVIQLQDTPTLPFNGPECLSRAEWRGHPLDDACWFTPPPTGPIERAQIAAAGQLSNVTSLDVDALVCPTTPCPVFRDGGMVFRDRDHLTTAFSRRLSLVLSLALDPTLPHGPPTVSTSNEGR